MFLEVWFVNRVLIIRKRLVLCCRFRVIGFLLLVENY